MSIELYKDEHHCCVMFSDLVSESGEAVQANQFLISDHGAVVILDPGGNMTYNELNQTIRKCIAPQHLDYIVASHADPDIIAPLDRWVTSTQATLLISNLWARFAPLQGGAIGHLLDWLDNLSCGIDLMDTPQYQLPHATLPVG
jgi:flavorubredoxin